MIFQDGRIEICICGNPTDEEKEILNVRDSREPITILGRKYVVDEYSHINGVQLNKIVLIPIWEAIL